MTGEPSLIEAVREDAPRPVTRAQEDALNLLEEMGVDTRQAEGSEAASGNLDAQTLAELDSMPADVYGEGEGPPPYTHVPRERAGEDIQAKMVSARLWLVSFADLFSLLLCFFVMLYTTRDPDFEQITEMSGKPYKKMHDGDQIGAEGGVIEAANITRIEYGDAANLEYLDGVLRKVVMQAKLEKHVRIAQGPDHLRLELDPDAAFEGGGLSAMGEDIAGGLARHLYLLSNRVSVVVGGDMAEGIARAGVFAEEMRDSGYRKYFTVLADNSADGDDLYLRVEADDGRVR